MALFGKKHNNLYECTIWSVYGLKINPRENLTTVKTNNDTIVDANPVAFDLGYATDAFLLNRYGHLSDAEALGRINSVYTTYFNEHDNHSQVEGEFLND